MAVHVGRHYKDLQAKNSRNIGKPENIFPHLTQNIVSKISISLSRQNNAKWDAKQIINLKNWSNICDLEQVGITIICIINYLYILILIYHFYQSAIFIALLYGLGISVLIKVSYIVLISHKIIICCMGTINSPHICKCSSQRKRKWRSKNSQIICLGSTSVIARRNGN